MLELLQFRHSPYNEKVRWALDIKQVPQFSDYTRKGEDKAAQSDARNVLTAAVVRARVGGQRCGSNC